MGYFAVHIILDNDKAKQFGRMWFIVAFINHHHCRLTFNYQENILNVLIIYYYYYCYITVTFVWIIWGSIWRHSLVFMTLILYRADCVLYMFGPYVVVTCCCAQEVTWCKLAMMTAWCTRLVWWVNWLQIIQPVNSVGSTIQGVMDERTSVWWWSVIRFYCNIKNMKQPQKSVCVCVTSVDDSFALLYISCIFGKYHWQTKSITDSITDFLKNFTFAEIMVLVRQPFRQHVHYD